MYVVAIARLDAPIDVEGAALASDLGVAAYEARLALASGMPAIVLATTDKARALDLLARLRGRGHGAVACDTSAVVASQVMTSMRRFRLGEAAVSLDDRPGERLSYDDVFAMVAAVHRQRIANESEVSDRKLSMGRAVMTGGLVMSKNVKRETRAVVEERGPVLYVFSRGGVPPWILRERGTVWTGHGRPIAASAGDNFRTAVGVLRERIPHAVYDDRLVTRRARAERVAVAVGGGGTTTTTSSEAGTDLLAHLLALWIARDA